MSDDQPVIQVPGWLKDYNKAVSKKAPNTGGPAGPGFCAVYCTFFWWVRIGERIWKGFFVAMWNYVVCRILFFPFFCISSSVRFILPLFFSCSTLGALFLFVVAGLMRNEYRYIHIHGDLPALSKSVTYAGTYRESGFNNFWAETIKNKKKFVHVQQFFFNLYSYNFLSSSPNQSFSSS